MADKTIPAQDSKLVTWSSHFATELATIFASVGVSNAQSTAFATLNTAWVNAYNLATAETTRTKPNITAKNIAKKAMLTNLRMLIAIIQGYPGTTDTLRNQLGLPNRDITPSPINPPQYAPGISVDSVFDRIIGLRLKDTENQNRKGRPVGVAGAAIYSYVGATPPSSISGWKSEGLATRTKFSVQIDAAVPAGSQIWFTAQWYTPRGQTGPAATPISTYIAGGLAQAA